MRSMLSFRVLMCGATLGLMLAAGWGESQIQPPQPGWTPFSPTLPDGTPSGLPSGSYQVIGPEEDFKDGELVENHAQLLADGPVAAPPTA